MADSQDTRSVPFSRRAIVAVLAAAPAAALPTIAGAISEPDPIFAAIERHKAAEARYCAACGLTDEAAAQNEDRVITTADLDEFDEADHVCDEAMSEFLMTPPTTVAGVRAFLRHCIDEESIEYFLGEALETLLRSPALADLEARS